MLERDFRGFRTLLELVQEGIWGDFRRFCATAISCLASHNPFQVWTSLDCLKSDSEMWNIESFLLFWCKQKAFMWSQTVCILFQSNLVAAFCSDSDASLWNFDCFLCLCWTKQHNQKTVQKLCLFRVWFPVVYLNRTFGDRLLDDLCSRYPPSIVQCFMCVWVWLLFHFALNRTPVSSSQASA